MPSNYYGESRPKCALRLNWGCQDYNMLAFAGPTYRNGVLRFQAPYSANVSITTDDYYPFRAGLNCTPPPIDRQTSTNEPDATLPPVPEAQPYCGNEARLPTRRWINATLPIKLKLNADFVEVRFNGVVMTFLEAQPRLPLPAPTQTPLPPGERRPNIVRVFGFNHYTSAAHFTAGSMVPLFYGHPYTADMDVDRVRTRRQATERAQGSWRC